MKPVEIKKGRLPGRPEHYRTPAVYINVPIMSIRKRQNRKTIYTSHQTTKSKAKQFRFWLFQPKTNYFNNFS